MSFGGGGCTSACKTGACNCIYGYASSGQTYTIGFNAGTATTPEQQVLQQILGTVMAMSQRMQELEDMLVDTNSGIDELLSERTFNSDEKVCGHSEEGCEGSDSTGDTPDPAEPSSSGQDEC